MKKSPIVVRDDTVFKDGETYSLMNDPLSFEIDQIVFTDYPPDELPEKIIVDPNQIVQKIIERRIGNLSYMSDVINLRMETNQKIKDAAPANSGEYLMPGYKNNPVTWDIFREIRRKNLNEYNLRQSSDALAPYPALSVFPMVGFSDWGELRCFGIIKDDCNDMVEFLKNAKKLSSSFFFLLFFKTSEIEKRFYYLTGYHRMKYERGEPIRRKNLEAGEESVSLAITVLKKYGGIAGYDALARGKKKLVVEEIARELLLRSDKQVYNIR